MTRFRRLATALWLALVLLAGQQAAAMHGLAHAVERVQQHDKSTPVKQTCDQCFLGAQLSGGIGVAIATLAVVPADTPHALTPVSHIALPSPRLNFLSRAPPQVL